MILLSVYLFLVILILVISNAIISVNRIGQWTYNLIFWNNDSNNTHNWQLNHSVISQRKYKIFEKTEKSDLSWYERRIMICVCCLLKKLKRDFVQRFCTCGDKTDVIERKTVFTYPSLLSSVYLTTWLTGCIISAPIRRFLWFTFNLVRSFSSFNSKRKCCNLTSLTGISLLSRISGRVMDAMHLYLVVIIVVLIFLRVWMLFFLRHGKIVGG